MKAGKPALPIVAVCLVVLMHSQISIGQETDVVRISGALPLTDLVSGWATDYMKNKPGAKITVFGKTAGHGYSQFLDGQANLVMATRKMLKEEQDRAAAKGIRVRDILVMNIPVAMVTNASNPVDSLTIDQLRDIYSGSISNWKDVGGPDEPIKVLQRPYPATGVAVLFKKQVLKDKDYRKDAVNLTSYKNMTYICEQSMAIGHMPSTGAFCDPKKYRIKILGLKKDAGSPAVHPGQPDYVMNMPFFFVWNADPPPKEVKEFVDYALTRAKATSGPH